MLYKKMKELPEEDLLYVSTDAITFKGKDNLKLFKMGTGLGEWKIEDSGNEFEGWNEQYYRIGTNIKASGVSKSKLSLKAIHEGKVETTAMFTMKMAWKKGEFENMGKFEDKIFNLSKTPKRFRPHPDFIIENLDSEMLYGVELAKKMRDIPMEN